MEEEVPSWLQPQKWLRFKFRVWALGFESSVDLALNHKSRTPNHETLDPIFVMLGSEGARAS